MQPRPSTETVSSVPEAALPRTRVDRGGAVVDVMTPSLRYGPPSASSRGAQACRTGPDRSQGGIRWGVSDLHCPATVLLVPVTEAGLQTASELAHRLAGRRIARVYARPLGSAHDYAAVVAAALGVDAVALEGLDDSRDVSWVQAVADLHRGETVVVVTDQPTSWDGVDAAITELSVDADGIVLR